MVIAFMSPRVDPADAPYALKAVDAVEESVLTKQFVSL